LVFTARVHDRQKRDGLWLPQHPFVQAVRNGSVSRRVFSAWVSQVHGITSVYGELLRAMCPPPPAGVWTDPWRDMDQLAELAGALGIEMSALENSQTNPATRAVQIWLRQNLTNRSEHVAAQVCWALVEAMTPESGAYLAEGTARHFGLKAAALEYLKSGMKSRRRADRYAASLLTEINKEDWPLIAEKTLMVSRLMAQVYDSLGEE
jgi:pyrroloquinoline quinone (PQQ) biosynthesis protein C